MLRWKRYALVTAVMVVVAAAFVVIGRRPEGGPSVGAELAPVSVTIDVSERRLRVTQDGEVVASYPVAVGTVKHPTPRGSFTVRRIIWNPRWVPPEAAWAKDEEPKAPGDPDNPMGRVKIFFKEPDYYIHGTYAEGSIGEAASHGCVRMLNPDVIELARTLMDHGAAPVPPGLIRRLINVVTRTKEVRLQKPVPVRVRT